MSGPLPTVERLQAFYASDSGQRAQRTIGAAIDTLWSARRQDRLLGLGYAPPWLEFIVPKVDRAICAMPARQGVHAWPADSANMACLVDPLNLPFAESLFDVVIAVHLLEHVTEPTRLMRELWRVLAPAGKVLIVVPHRRGRWLLDRTSPLLVGQSYTQGRLAGLLRATMFAPMAWSQLLGRPGWMLPAALLVVATKRDGPQLIPIGKAQPARLQPVGLNP